MGSSLHYPVQCAAGHPLVWHRGNSDAGQLTEDTRGAIWAACADALRRYDGRQWTRVGSDWGFPDTWAQAVFVDQRGTLWIAGEHQIFSLERQSQRLQPTGTRVERGGDFIESRP
jgi:ligand-binding sensor domain-containing protein